MFPWGFLGVPMQVSLGFPLWSPSGFRKVSLEAPWFLSGFPLGFLGVSLKVPQGFFKGLLDVSLGFHSGFL